MHSTGYFEGASFEVTDESLKGIFYSPGDSQAVPGTIKNLAQDSESECHQVPSPGPGAIHMIRVALPRTEVAAAKERGLDSPGLHVDFLCKACPCPKAWASQGAPWNYSVLFAFQQHSNFKSEKQMCRSLAGGTWQHLYIPYPF